MPELKPEQVTILIDNREQNPWDMSPMKMEEATLQSGDYSVKGLEDYVRVERKELSDLVNCFTAGRDRFKRELERLRAFPKRVVVVEGSWLDLASANYRSRLNPKSACGSICSWSGFYQIGFMFCGDRPHAQGFTRGYLLHIARSFTAKVKAFGVE